MASPIVRGSSSGLLRWSDCISAHGHQLFNILINIGGGIECTLCKAAEGTKLSAAGGTRGKGCHPKGSGPAEKRGHVNLMKLNNAMHKVLHLGQGKPKHQNRLGNEWTESSHVEDLEVQVNEKPGHKLATRAQSPESPNHMQGYIKRSTGRHHRRLLLLCSTPMRPQTKNSYRSPITEACIERGLNF